MLPGSSEAVLLGLLASGQGSPAVLVLFATLGNVAGAAVNRGLWSLLLSWVAVVGDPLTRMAGVLRVPFGRFLGLVTIGKLARYRLLVLTWQHWGVA